MAEEESKSQENAAEASAQVETPVRTEAENAPRQDDAREIETLRAEYGRLKEQYDALLANRANAQASTGSVAGGQAYEKDYYTSQEWDRLPQNLQQKFIRSGRIFDFMKKWSGKS